MSKATLTNCNGLSLETVGVQVVEVGKLVFKSDILNKAARDIANNAVKTQESLVAMCKAFDKANNSDALAMDGFESLKDFAARLGVKSTNAYNYSQAGHFYNAMTKGLNDKFFTLSYSKAAALYKFADSPTGIEFLNANVDKILTMTQPQVRTFYNDNKTALEAVAKSDAANTTLDNALSDGTITTDSTDIDNVPTVDINAKVEDAKSKETKRGKLATMYTAFVIQCDNDSASRGTPIALASPADSSDLHLLLSGNSGYKSFVNDNPKSIEYTLDMFMQAATTTGYTVIDITKQSVYTIEDSVKQYVLIDGAPERTLPLITVNIKKAEIKKRNPKGKLKALTEADYDTLYQRMKSGEISLADYRKAIAGQP